MVNRWQYRSEIGTFSIQADNVNVGRWELRINDERLGSYQTPRMAADAVASQTTGYAAWDQLKGATAPGFLEDWAGA
jgi:hypothetical protein